MKHKKNYKKKLTCKVKVKKVNVSQTAKPANPTVKYTVQFDTNGGSEISPLSVNEGNVMKKPENPTKTGYKFAGWYVDAELTGEYDFADEIKKDFTLYAKWKVDDVSDRDGDGLKDGEEVNTYKTDSTLPDTDGDGAEDGWEIQNSYDPLKVNSSFKVQEEVSTEGGEITASLEVETNENPQSFKLEETTEAGLLDGAMPGYIGGAVSVDSDSDEFDKAVISFSFDSKKLNENAEPTIYEFDEETQLLHPVSTEISENKASAKIEKLDTYILLDRNTVDDVWDTEILPPDERSHDDSVLDIAYVIDYSASMDDNDPNYHRLKIVNEFINKLRENQDRATVVKFAGYATTLVPLTTDKEMLKNAVEGITNISSDSCGNAEAGTNGTDGLHAALEQLEVSDGTGKYIIFLTDGEDTTSTYEYEDLIAEAKNNHITIYSVGMGEADKELLSHVAESTGGKYYYASAVDVNDISEDSLLNVFSEIESTTIDRELDSNGDGISDYYTRLMCEGKLSTGTGIALFRGCSYEDIQNDLDGDFDNDGLKNGEEVRVKYDSDTGRTYLYVISSPICEDTDADGIEDKEDTAPLYKGLAGGVTGELTIVSCHPEDQGFTGGHAWLSYKSYVNDIIDISGLLTGFVWDSDAKGFVQQKLDQYEIKKDGHMAIGNAGTGGASDALSTISGSCGGILYNREFYGAWENNDFYLDVAAYTREITEKQLNDVLTYCEENNYYNLYSHNCSSVASEAWEAAYGTSDGFDAKTTGFHGVYSVFDTPSTLKDNILKKDNADTDYRATMLDIIRNWR